MVLNKNNLEHIILIAAKISFKCQENKHILRQPQVVYQRRTQETLSEKYSSMRNEFTKTKRDSCLGK